METVTSHFNVSCSAALSSDIDQQRLNRFLVPNQPSSLITKEFLRTGVLPKPRNETLVSVYSPGMQRDPIPDPYEVQTGEAAGDIESK